LFSALFSRPKNPEERKIRAWCRQKLGLTPGDLALYRQALRHSSAVPEDRPELPNNERLEFLGDAILDAIVGQFLFNKYPDQGEGFLTRMRSKLVSRHQLNILAKHVEIEKVVESNIGRSHETSVPGNALEALIGAIFLDKGFDKTNKAVLTLIQAHFDLKTVEQEDRDNKSRLLEWGQKRKRKVEFRITEEASRSGRGKLYIAEACIDGEVRGTGKGHSKKKAEQDAANAAYRSMRPHGGRGEQSGGDREERGERPRRDARRGPRDRDKRSLPKGEPRPPQPRAALPPHEAIDDPPRKPSSTE
jgi:ribonuclease III